MKKSLILLMLVAGISVNFGLKATADTTVKLEDLNPDMKEALNKMQKEYGSGDFNKYYELQKSDNGTYKFNEVETPSEGAITVNYKYQSTYGNSEGNNVKYFDWNKDENGNTALKSVAQPTEGKSVTYKYSDETKKNRIKTFDGTDITGDFVGLLDNHLGGAIHLEAYKETINNINANFVNNSVSGYSNQNIFGGGAIYIHNVNIENLNSVFIGNHSDLVERENRGGAIFTGNYTEIKNMESSFIGNYAKGGYSKGGALCNYISSSIETITNSNFIGNYAAGTTAHGGAIYNDSSAKIGSIINGNFIGNYTAGTTAHGGAIYNSGDIETAKNGNFIGNYVKSKNEAYGGAIYNDMGAKIGRIINGNFIGNYAEGTTAHGGAIYTKGDLSIIADNGKSIFTGNTANGESEAIYADYESFPEDSPEHYWMIIPEITLESKNKGQIIFNDAINGKEGYKVKLTGTSDSTIEINNDIKNAEIEHTGSVVTNIYDGKYLSNNNSLTMTSGDMNIKSLSLDGINLKKLNLNGGNINLDKIDVDLKNEKMGRITAQQYEGTNGNIVVNGLNILNDTQKDEVGILFADEAIRDRVQNNVFPAETNSQIAYSPIYKYKVSYSTDNKYGDNGYFVFTRGDFIGTETHSNPSESYNPAVLTNSVSTQAGGYATMNEAYNFAFEHTDSFSTLPSSERAAAYNVNKYAINEPSVAIKEEINNSFWVRPYTTFESIPLKNGPDVDTITYGTLIGADGDFLDLKNGWKTLLSVYFGYNGSTQHYQGVDTVQNGGLLGYSQSFYKDNFFSAITASVGASLGSSDNMYGNEEFSMLMSGIAVKSGYNFGYNRDKFIIQPSLLMAYTFVNTFDYTNAAGVRIDSDPLHAVQIRPNIKFVYNSESGWQPYIGAGMVWNILDKSDVKANDVKLPSMSIKPYAEYGVGIQKRWKDKYTGFVQVMARSGGRNGAAISLGLNMKLGESEEKL